jgi:hypothetical protein
MYNSVQWHLLKMNCLLPLAPTHISRYQSLHLWQLTETSFLLIWQCNSLRSETTQSRLLAIFCKSGSLFCCCTYKSTLTSGCPFCRCCKKDLFISDVFFSTAKQGRKPSSDSGCFLTSLNVTIGGTTLMMHCRMLRWYNILYPFHVSQFRFSLIIFLIYRKSRFIHIVNTFGFTKTTVNCSLCPSR